MLRVICIQLGQRLRGQTEGCCSNPEKFDGDVGQDGGNEGDGEKLLNLGYILKLDPTSILKD